jgi:hypothetical protein
MLELARTEKGANFYICIQNFNLNPLPDAEVTIQNASSKKSLAVAYNKDTKQYSLKGLQPGKYSFRVRYRDWSEDTRIIALHVGNNYFYSTLAPEGTPFYFGVDGEKVYFTADENKILLNVQGKDARAVVPKVLNKIGLAGTSILPPRQKAQSDNATFLISLPDAEKRKDALAILENLIKEMLPNQGVMGRLALPMFRGEFVVEGLTNQLVVKFQSGVTEQEAQEIAKKLEFNIVRRINYLGNAYLWERKGTPTYDLLKVAKELMKNFPVVYAEPNVLVQIELDVFTPNDYLYPEQQHFQVIHADDAWDTLDDIDVTLRAGSPNITIAVLDSNGVSPSHLKLTGNLTDGTAKMVANFDFTYWTNQTDANLAGDHGTQCASSATAVTNTNFGTSGLAGNCHLVGARLPADWTGLDIADAWIWVAGFQTGSTRPNFPPQLSKGADVISNSYGISNTWNNTIKDALDFISIYGRSGKGCVMVFSVGNLGYKQFSTIRRYAAYERTIAVGSSINANPTNPCNSLFVDQNGNSNNLPAVVDTRTYYSPYGPEMDIVAPSHTSYDPNLPGAQIRDPVMSSSRANFGDWPANAAATTTLTSAAASGATSLQVASTTGFNVGEYVLLIGPGIKPNETRRINSIPSGKLNVNALTNSYPAGTSVITGPNDYAMNPSIGFGGTSHSCPTVAGAAALLLSVNPSLTWVQVREILRTTATRIDTGQTNAVGRWVDNDGDGINEFSQWYGYGRLSVNAAVIEARDHTLAADVVVRDNLIDSGAVPSGGWHADSPDIWVSRTDDPIPTIAYTASPPHQNPLRGQDNYVYMRVKNIGTAPTNEVYLRVSITHFPGFEFRYPQEWQPSTRPGDPIPSPLLPGTYLIREERIDNLAQGNDTIVKMTWPQNLIPPKSVVVGGVTTTWHPCLLAEVSPHDGPAPAGATFDVKRDNNLAQKNITIDDPGDTSSDIVAGVVAGTIDASGVKSIIIDRSLLPSSYRVLVKSADESYMQNWLKLLDAGQIQVAQPLLDNEEKATGAGGKGCTLTLLDSARIKIDCCEGKRIIVYAPAQTKMEIQCITSQKQDSAKLNVGTYQDRQVIFFEGGTDAIELPMRLATNQFIPLAIGLIRPAGAHSNGSLKVTQKLGNGELSPGYSIEG